MKLLEEHIFFLMEMLGQGYADIMGMPMSRRHRIVSMKADLESKRAKELARVSRRKVR